MTINRAVISIDFELFRHTPAYRSASGELNDDTVGLDGWQFLRDVLSANDVTATFFIVGEVAQEYPDVIRDIAQDGHEVASHTQTHQLLSSLDTDRQLMELNQSRETIESVTGEKVTGVRVPAFDIPTGLFQRISTAGYSYDSSIVPARRIPGWYGGEYDTTTPCLASNIEPGGKNLGELPVSVMPGVRLPLSGAWTRLLGRTYTRAGIKLLTRLDKIPVLYFHPWEMVDLPEVEGVPNRVTWRTGEWLRETIRRLLAMELEFVTAHSIIEEEM